MAFSPYYKTINLPKAIRKKPLAETNNLTLKMSYDDYDIQRFIPDPEDIFKESGGLSKDIKHLLTESNIPSLASYEEHLLDSMVTMIWASNWLEKAGSSFEITEKICKEILLGRQIQEPSEGDLMYQEIRDNLIAKNVDNDPDHNAVLRSWKQVVQHAYALQYVALHLSLTREPLSEEIIKRTHKS
ncbi:uncharacterized protein PAC_12943 [Phialocephala subalpina]|uniref:Uncharacterized protein n=1 Tax=Phialocephala subalpina TaxID=576137 RepID=A0A1L7XDH9_9HELO|nr:uncharacterized protein PAC_12943 [Phialocephala subalpina]